MSVGLSYTLINNNTEYEVTGIGTCTDTEIIIPDTYNDLSVTSIGDNAFYGCKTLKSVTLGTNVKEIESFAFYGCTSISKVYYLGTVDEWCKIDFSGSYSNPVSISGNLYIDNEMVEDLEITTATIVSDNAFYGCNTLKSVTLGTNVKEIEYFAFYDCTSISKVYYLGTASDWNNISISSTNGYLTSATRYYYSEIEPTEEGNYWHYDTDGKTILVWGE